MLAFPGVSGENGSVRRVRVLVSRRVMESAEELWNGRRLVQAGQGISMLKTRC